MTNASNASVSSISGPANASNTLLFRLPVVGDAPALRAALTANSADAAALRTFNDGFEKATATKSYGLRDAFYFRVIVPIASVFSAKFANAHAEDSELYKQHQELITAVEKVQKTYKVFLASEKAVNSEMDNVAYRQARLTEYLDATEFVVSYKDLIALATLQADQLAAKSYGGKNQEAKDSTRAALFQDVHEALDDELGTGKILSSINSLRARLFVQDPMENPETLRHYYESFVEQFVENRAFAVNQSGDEANSAKIEEALYDGLASVPGIENVLPEFNQKLNLDSSLTTYAGEMREIFLSEIRRLINGNQPITEQRLAKIKYKGISLLRVVDPAFVRKLEQARLDLIVLQGLEAAAKELGAQKASNLTLRAPHAALLSEQPAYSARELLHFLQNGAFGVSADEINRLIEAGQDEVFEFIRKALPLLTDIKRLQDQNDEEIRVEKEAIEAQQRELATLDGRGKIEDNRFDELNRALTAARQDLENERKKNDELDKRNERLAQQFPIHSDLEKTFERDRRGALKERQETITDMSNKIARTDELFKQAAAVVETTRRERMEMVQTHEAAAALIRQNRSQREEAFQQAIQEKQAKLDESVLLSGKQLLDFAEELTFVSEVSLANRPADANPVEAQRVVGDILAARHADSSIKKIDIDLTTLEEATLQNAAEIASWKTRVTFTSNDFTYENTRLNVNPAIFDATSIATMDSTLKGYIDSAKKINKNVVDRVAQIGISIYQEIDRKEAENQPLTAREKQFRTELRLRGLAHRGNDLNGLSAVAVTLPPNPLIVSEPASAAPARPVVSALAVPPRPIALPPAPAVAVPAIHVVSAPAAPQRSATPPLPFTLVAASAGSSAPVQMLSPRPSVSSPTPASVRSDVPASGRRLLALTTAPSVTDALRLASPPVAVAASSSHAASTLPVTVVLKPDSNRPALGAHAQRHVTVQNKATKIPSASSTNFFGFLERLFEGKKPKRAFFGAAPARTVAPAQAASSSPAALPVAAPASSSSAPMLPVTVDPRATNNGSAQGDSSKEYVHFRPTGLSGFMQSLKELLGIPTVHNLPEM
jgi:hypothetical protein